MSREIPSLTEFQKYFSTNYVKAVESYLRRKSLRRYVHPIYFYLLAIVFIVLNQYFPEHRSVFNPLIFCFFLLLLISLVIWGWLQKLPSGLNEKDVVTYYLLKSAEAHEASITERKSGYSDRAESFKKKSLQLLNECEKLLELVIKRMRRTDFNLLQTNETDRLRQTIKDRIYPMVKNPSRNGDGIVLVALAKFFFYEEEYKSISSVNMLLEKTLDYAPISEEEFSRTARFLRSIRTSLVFTALAIFIGVTLAILSAIFFFRYPTYGAEGYLDCLSDNSVQIVIGIVVAWAAIFLPLQSKVGRE